MSIDPIFYCVVFGTTLPLFVLSVNNDGWVVLMMLMQRIFTEAGMRDSEVQLKGLTRSD